MRISLTIFLFRDVFASVDDAVAACDLSGFQNVQADSGVIAYEVRCFIRAARVQAPKWLSFYQVGFAISDDALRTRSASLVLFLESEGRVFAVAAGAGHHRIPKSALELDFGLKTTLNAVGPEMLRSLQSRTVEPLTVQKLVVANRNTRLQSFGLDQFQELLAKIEGKPVKESLGITLAGSDSLILGVDLDIADLHIKCSELLKVFRKRTYKRQFGFVDQIRPVRDRALAGELDNKLSDILKNSQDYPVALALPSIDRYGAIASYAAHHGRSNQMDLHDLQIERLRQFLATLPADNDPLRRVRIVASSAEGETALAKPLDEWIVAEIRHRNSLYVRSAGAWYQVDKGYVKEINTSVKRIKVIKKNGYLPKMQIHSGVCESEADYNMRCASPTRMCMDKKNITIERYGAVEPCDLFTIAKHLIHVKKQASSATLSHLWGQGYVSGQLLLDSREYRKKLRAKLGVFSDQVSLDRISPSDYTVGTSEQRRNQRR